MRLGLFGLFDFRFLSFFVFGEVVGDLKGRE